MELVYLRILGDAVDPGPLYVIESNPGLAVSLGVIVVAGVLAIRHFFKKKKGK